MNVQDRLSLQAVFLPCTGALQKTCLGIDDDDDP